MTLCVLIADDLTGALDAAAKFAGVRTAGLLAGHAGVHAGIPPYDVLAFSTDSRDVDPAEARRRLRALAPVIRDLAPRILFKKIDSTLRGNTGHEIVAALDAFACDAAIVNPAFPAMGRTVESSTLRFPNAPPIDLPAYLRSYGADPCRHVAPSAIEAAIADGARFLTLDAVCPADLHAIAAFDTPRRILWAGSAGLSAALADRLGCAPPTRPDPPARGSALFCIGSDHPVTLEQQRRLEARGETILPIPRGTPEPAVRALLADRRPAALFLTGGDTASLVCRALDVESIDVRAEFSPGIPLGTLRGGPFDGLPVVTKSGGFGGPAALTDIADYFHA